jgi:hypothetical protein
MSRTRIGELLGKLVPLSHLDVEEILQEQRGSRRRFGEIAIAFGLCRPEHLWKAWSNQLVETHERVDLDAIGIDAQAVCLLPPNLAITHRAMPVRCLGDALVIATSETPTNEALSEMSQSVGMPIKYVRADSHQIDRAIHHHYQTIHA